MAGRTYDVALVDRIAERAKVVEEDGLAIESRPVPDDDRENVVDPRVLALTLKKLSGEVAIIPMNDVVTMRGRLNKPTYPIISTKVEHRVELMEFPDRWIPLHVWTPENHEAGTPVLCYFHGGGWTFGQVAAYENAMAYLAEVSGCVVTYTEYRLAPENPFPKPLLDCSATVDWVVAHADELGIDPDKVAVMGDSAGGSLANGVVQMQASRNPIKLDVCLYGFVCGDPVPEDFTYDWFPVIEEQKAAAKNRVDRIKDSIDAGNMYGLHEDIYQDPLVGAMAAKDVSMFPRTLVVYGGYDYLRIDSQRFARKLADGGVDVRTIRYEGCDHGWFESCGEMPQAEDLCRVVAEELRKL